MNLYKILNDIEKSDADVYERLSSRRNAFRFGGKIALAAVPLVMGNMFQKAYGQSASSVLDVLNYALTLEYLEDDFYIRGLAAPGLIPTSDRAIFTQIGRHETAHVAFLRTAISGASGTPVSKPTFDFTARGQFPDVFTNYQTFLTLSQAFEDTGVRAYKGQAGALIANNDVLTAARQIHSVEARHASEVRRLRGQKGWITGNMGAPAAVYAGEETTMQGGANVTGITAAPASAVGEAFDEPLTMQAVLAIATPFIVC
jgi:hypothetical protein